MMRQIPSAIRAEIERRLHAIEQQKSVQILMAVESGSRAWGFPSPDSDYDVRFVYVRTRDWYLGLSAGRDVIEQPIVDDIDLNGWDVRKALSLLLKSNAVISEWIDSPIRYRNDHRRIADIRELADHWLDGRALAHHYARLGGNAAARWLEGDDQVPVKRYFYALRPALAIRHLRLNPDQRPPMALDALISGCALDAEQVNDISALVAAKRLTNEKANAARKPALDALIRAELAHAEDVPRGRERDADAAAQANAIFLALVNG